ncbi:hmg-box dna-binding protein [Moniliophthora roreri MCA 2997]|uniref:Hmg-box dna-binding protein n=2 Tax=Moniliophthora roreri TaxID=221103 RepID=V2XJC2_MONRO|nr:hmg-box dna-binding protein [Moniliophthora roreri MCA 2997]KAI3615153.1 hmg-box dna-binding protein [Moniliophthora roreri]
MATAKEPKIPRPPNAWILYRSDMAATITAQLQQTGQRKTQAQISKEISEMWKNVDPQTKMEYERRAEAKKHEHSEMYPGYRFQPMKKEEKQKQKELKRISDKEARQKSRAIAHPYARPQRTVSPSEYPTPTSFIPPPHLQTSSTYPMDFGHHNFGPSPPVYAAESPASVQTPESQPSSLEPPAPTLSLDATHIRDPAGSSNNGTQDYHALDSSNHWNPAPFSHDSTPAGASAIWPGSSQQTQEFVSLNIPQPSYVQVPEFDETLATMTRTDNPSIFQLSNIDYSLLDSNAELDVALGSLDFDPSIFSGTSWNDILQTFTNGDMGALDVSQPQSEAGPSQSMHDEQSYTNHLHQGSANPSRNTSGNVPSHHSSDAGSFNDMYAYINYDGGESSTDNTILPPAPVHISRFTSSSSDAYVPESSTSAGSPFTPPIHNNHRRPGGSWRPNLQREVPVPQWKVPAS